MKPNNIETIPEIENKPLAIDGTFLFELSKEEFKIFEHYACRYLNQKPWTEIQDSTGRTMYFIIQRLMKNLDPLFDYEAVSIHLKYPDLWALNRLCRITQLEINEENEEQALFQMINQKLFPFL